MKYGRGLFGLVLVLGFVLGRPVFVLAEEDGRKDDTSPALGAVAAEPAGGIVPAVSEMDEVAILTEAAAALDMTKPELAAKLRALALNEQNEKGEANEETEEKL